MPEVRLPTLATCGRHDEAMLLIVGTVGHGIAGWGQVLFERSSNMTHVEEADPCLNVLKRLLARHDGF